MKRSFIYVLVAILFTPFLLHAQTLPSSGLVSRYTLDTADVVWSNTTSEIKDRTSNFNGDAVSLSSANALTSARLNQGLSLSANGYVSLGQPAFALAPTNAYTVMAWIRLPVGASGGTIFSRALSDPTQQQLNLSVANGKLQATVGGTTNSSNINVANSQWVHVALVNNGTSNTLYINGVAKTTATAGAGISAGVDYLIGARRDTSNASTAGYFTGDIDDVSIFNRALTASEVSTAFAGTNLQTLTTIGGWNAYVHLPSDYATTGSQKYPVIIFIPGLGEVGTNPAGLLANGSPSYWVSTGNTMEFMVNGVLEKPIVISIQPPTSFPNPAVVDAQITNIVNQYRVDTSRIYLTGLSMGGWSWDNYVVTSQAYADRPAAIMAMHAVEPDNINGVRSTPRFSMFANAGGKWWGIEGQNDYRRMGTDLAAQEITAVMNNAVANSGRYTKILAPNPGNTHCCWNVFYDPTWVDQGETIYTWMLKQRKGTTTPVNQSPTANAGTSQTITLPTTTATLTGSGSDPDGSVASYQWSQVSGPTTATITTPTAATTTITNLSTAGTYVFGFVVKDNQGASSAQSTVSVTVNAQVVTNTPPTANAGADQTIALPTSSVTLSGVGTDTDGTIASYAWSKFSGGSATIASPSAASTTVTGLTQGSYTFRLTVTDNQGATAADDMVVTVNPAGTSVVIPGLTNRYTLDTANINWSAATSELQDTVGNFPADAQNLSSTNSVGGKLGQALSFNGSTQYAVVGQPPISLVPTSSYTISTWVNPSTTGQTAALITKGQSNQTAREVQVYLSSGVPVAVVGGSVNAPVTNTLPANQWTHVALVNDATIGKNMLYVNGVAVGQATDGTATLPGVDLMISARRAASNTDAAVFFAGGIDDVRLYNRALTQTEISAIAATTDSASTGSTGTTNQPPSANAGPDQTVPYTMPTTVTLSGSGTDLDGTIVSYQWTKVSGGFVEGTPTSPNSATTTITNLSAGMTYTYRLKVTDNQGATATDDVVVTVSSRVYLSPVATVGADQTYTIGATIPGNSVTLSGSCTNPTDPGNQISTCIWSQVSGPTSTISQGAPAGTTTLTTNASATVSASSSAVYVFRLTAKNTAGLTATKDLKVNIDALPIINVAASTISVTLPTNSATLSGSATDSDGTVVSYQWYQQQCLSGCTTTQQTAAATITSPTSATTTVTGLAQGTYRFYLIATDNVGGVSTQNGNIFVTVTVNPNPANQPPVANAGPDQVITTPTNTVTLSATGSTDTDGTITKYLWIPMTMGCPATITNRSASTTTVTGLGWPYCVFRLDVTDDKGSVSSDFVVVGVKDSTKTTALPTANAGADQALSAGVTTATLIGSAKSLNGLVTSYSWSKVSGGSATITTPTTSLATTAAGVYSNTYNTLTTTVTGLAAGTYTFRLTATDSFGQVATDDVVVTVAGTTVPSGAITKVVTGEYATAYITANGRVSSIFYNGSTYAPYDFGLTNIVDGYGAQYDDIVLDTSGKVYIIGLNRNTGVPFVTPVPTDSTGAAFTGNSKVYGFYKTYMTLRNGAIWYWGVDFLDINRNASMTDTIAVPTPLTMPNGKTFTKLVTANLEGGAILALASDGTVWLYRSTALAPTQVSVTGARDIAAVSSADYVIETATDLLAWSPNWRGDYVGLGQNTTTPTSIKSQWTAKGVVFPTKELIGNDNTLHIIDQNDNLFAVGENVMGEIGNGAQWPIWRTYYNGTSSAPFAWNFGPAQYLSPVVQIPGKYKNLQTGTTITFYLYAQDMGNNWYSWGRNKSRALGNGVTLASNDEAIYPNFRNVPAPTLVTPLTTTWTILPPFSVSAAQAPIAHAGINQYISTTSTTLYGSGSSQQEGSIASYAWSQVSGPNTASLVTPNTMNTTVSGLVTGTYVFRLTVTNNTGVSASNTVSVVVNGGGNIVPQNQSPVANAGTAQTIALPATTTTLTGSGTDSDGTIASYAWTKVSGGSATITTPSAAITTVTGLAQGSYTFQLTVTDNQGATGIATVTVTVNSQTTTTTGSRITLTNSMLINEKMMGDETKLINEPNSLALDSSGNPISTTAPAGCGSWWSQPSGQRLCFIGDDAPTVPSTKPWPASVVIDLGRTYSISDVYAYAESFSPIATTDNTFVVKAGVPFQWGTTLGTLTADGVQQFNQWKRISGGSVQTRYLQLTFNKNFGIIREIAVYGTPVGSAPTTPTTIAVPPKYTFEKMVGTNIIFGMGQAADGTNYDTQSGFNRWFAGNNYIFTNTDTFINPGGMSSQESSFVDRMLAAGVDVWYAIQGAAPSMASPTVVSSGAYDTQKSIDYTLCANSTMINGIPTCDTISKNPASYAHKAWLSKKLAQAYGTRTNPMKYIELANEPDGNWHGAGYYGPYELAAMMSADYDGHCNTLTYNGESVGVKNSGTTMKVIMPGLANYDARYLNAMMFWFKNNRTCAQTFPADVINGHAYPTTLGAQGSGTTGVGLPPEDTTYNLKSKLQAIVDFRNQNVPTADVINSEIGWDTYVQSIPNQTNSYCVGATYGNSWQYAPIVGSYSEKEVQGQWIARMLLLQAEIGLDWVNQYWLADQYAENTTCGTFNTSGLMSFTAMSNYKPVYVLKPSWYYLQTLRYRLAGMKFTSARDIAVTGGTLHVQKYTSVATPSKKAYVVWSPTATGFTVSNVAIPFDASGGATVVQLDTTTQQGTVVASSTAAVSSVTINASERPVIILVDETATNGLKVATPTTTTTATTTTNTSTTSTTTKTTTTTTKVTVVPIKVGDTVSVTATKLNVRSAPSTTAPVVGQTTKGTTGTVTFITGKWAQVKFDTGILGYVSTTYLKKI